MASYLIRRILLMFPTVLGMTAVVFFIMKAAPGDVTQLLMSREGEMRAGDRAARMAYLQKRYGLDAPAYVQYFRWLNKISPIGVWTEGEDAPAGVGFVYGHDEQHAAKRFGFKSPELGQSFVHNRPVSELIGRALPITVLLNLISIPIVYTLAISGGVYAARYRGGLYDRVTGVALMAMWAMPVMWIGVLLQGFLTSEQYVNAFPTAGLHDLFADAMPFLPHASATGSSRGWLVDFLWHVVLPVTCLSYGGFAFLARLSRGAVLENLRADYVRTARAKGVDDRTVLWRHVFRNSLLPLITVAAQILPEMLAGSIIVEYIFSIHGMGHLMIDAIEFRDQELVMAETLASGVLTVTAYLISDVLYTVADPRVSYE
jgi:ABC-type dipeptide/oligopeptide/nickel transport system permease component